MSDDFLRLEGVGKRYPSGSSPAIEDVTLSIPRGSFVCLLGPSGCGKTTTLNAIAGFVKPDTGRIYLKGRLLNDVAVERRGTAMVFQNYALFPHMTVGRNVAFGLKMRKVPRRDIERRVPAVLELVHLTGLENRYPRQLSGGQQQRVALARALVVEPEVLLLDEPLSNLDARLRDQMRFELKAIHQRVGITTLFVTHDLHEAFTLAEIVVVMDSGHVCQVGTPFEIYNRPADGFVADFIGTFNTLRGKIQEIHPESGAAVILREGLKIAVRPEAWMKPRQDVILRLRPERLRLCPDPPLQESILAKVERRLYLGSLVHYTLSVGDLSLTALSTDSGGGGPHTGDIVPISWTAGDLWVLPASAAEPADRSAGDGVRAEE